MNRARHIRPEFRHRTSEYQIAFSDWVQTIAPWEVFVTMTYRWEASPRSAAKCFEKFMSREMRGVSYLYVVGRDPDGCGNHIHGLWCDCGERLRSDIWQKWFNRYGINRIEPIKSPLDVADYCTKHLNEETLEWNIRLLGNRRNQTTV